MKKIMSLLLCATLLISLASCAPATGDTKISMVLDWVPNTNHTGLFVAQEMGYYKDAGLSVDIVQPPEDGALSLLASGKAQFAISFQESIGLALSADSPLPVTAVASVIDHNISGILSLKEKNIVTPKDLEGKNFASWDSPFETAVLTQIMKNDGADFGKLNKIPATVTDVITALKTNMDAVWVYYGWDGIATELAGIETNYISFNDIDPALDFYTPVIASSDAYLKSNPDDAKKFLAATKKGYEYAIDNPKKAAEILVKHNPEISLELATKSQGFLSKEYRAEKASWGTFDSQRWNKFYQWFKDNGLTDKDLTDKGFTNDFIKGN